MWFKADIKKIYKGKKTWNNKKLTIFLQVHVVYRTKMWLPTIRARVVYWDYLLIILKFTAHAYKGQYQGKQTNTQTND